jgi:hypothetical protein
MAAQGGAAALSACGELLLLKLSVLSRWPASEEPN